MARLKVDYLVSQEGAPHVFLDGHPYNRNAVHKTCIIGDVSLKRIMEDVRLLIMFEKYH